MNCTMSIFMYIRFVGDIIGIIFYTIYALVGIFFRICVPHPRKSLNGEIILVTGGANGIGREICRELVMKEREITIIIWDVDEAGIEKTVRELRSLRVKKAVGFKVDISDRHQVKKSADQIRSEIGDVTMLFNNAGISGEIRQGWSMSPESIEKVFSINMISHCWTIQEFLPSMIKKGKGHVIETCSMLGIIYAYNGAPYVASKHGLAAYAECIKEDIRRIPGKPKIYFTIFYPNFTATNMTAKLNLESKKYPFFMPRYTAMDVAQRVLKGVLCNEEHIYFPNCYRFLPGFLGMLPSKVYRQLMDMVDVTFDTDDVIQKFESQIV